MNIIKIALIPFFCTVFLLYSAHSITHEPLLRPIFEQFAQDINNNVFAIKAISDKLLVTFYDYIPSTVRDAYKNKTLSINDAPYFMAQYIIMQEAERRYSSKGRAENEDNYLKEVDHYLSNLTFDDLVCIQCNEKDLKNPLMWEIKGENSPSSTVNELLKRKGISSESKQKFAEKRQDRIKELVEENRIGSSSGE